MTRLSDRYEYVVIGLGGLGSAAAYFLAKRGCSVLGLEQFEFAHSRGASHDTSRILRHSYHTPEYVALTFAAYDDWAMLEVDSGEQLVTQVGGLDLFPPGGAIPITDYTTSMAALEVDYEELDARDVRRRWPQLALPADTVGLFQQRASIVPAARGTAALRAQARRFGATLVDRTAVERIEAADDVAVVRVLGQTIRARRVIVCADAWTRDLMLPLGVDLPLIVTLEQVTYFSPPDPAPFRPGRLPLWIWMDDPSFYGFPCYGEPTVKAARDCSGITVTAENRPFDADPERLKELSEFMAVTLPGSGPAVRSKTCLYTLPPDRDFVLDAVPGAGAVLVGLGAGHGFKFAPTFGRLLSELACTGETSADVTSFALDREALTCSDYPVNWLV